MKNIATLSIACLIFAPIVTGQQNVTKTMKITPPKAQKITKILQKHGDTRTDPYYWLNNPEDKNVIDYLNAENAYYSAMTAHTDELKESLFQEMKARIKEDDHSVPYKLNGYYYI